MTSWSLTGVKGVGGDGLSVFWWSCMVPLGGGIHFQTMHELPVFEPNEFFWKNHWQEGKEEKWMAYARAIQTIMCEVGGLKLS